MVRPQVADGGTGPPDTTDSCHQSRKAAKGLSVHQLGRRVQLWKCVKLGSSGLEYGPVAGYRGQGTTLYCQRVTTVWAVVSDRRLPTFQRSLLSLPSGQSPTHAHTRPRT
ncbi:hypothetical protein L798_09424 [Zootermopsis nevadensis]|uniref:Uncharacterized protein n=1 Tax=Zootermopsis nevadensis TaxID=136037 RepID=A0A067QYZ4_ZOONE|nr:hypothetical protein L798_09424 [Zootermopsis nevadensis]